LASAAAFAEQHTAAIIAAAAIIERISPLPCRAGRSIDGVEGANVGGGERSASITNGLSGFLRKNLFGKIENHAIHFAMTTPIDSSSATRAPHSAGRRARSNHSFYLFPPGEAKKEKRFKKVTPKLPVRRRGFG